MPAPLSHTEITKALKRLALLANDLDDAYRWGHILGYQRRPGGGDSVNVSTSGTSNPTRQIVKDKAQARVREDMTKASRHILRAEAEMEAARNAINDAFATTAAVHRVTDEPLLGEPIRKSELRVAEKAAGRRKGRGEGWGEG